MFFEYKMFVRKTDFFHIVFKDLFEKPGVFSLQESRNFRLHKHFSLIKTEKYIYIYIYLVSEVPLYCVVLWAGTFV